MSIRNAFLGLCLTAPLISGCGGGSGSSSGGVPTPPTPPTPYFPEVTVAGLAAAETVNFTIQGEAFAATADGTFTASAQVTGDFTAAVTSNPIGKSCLFPSGASYTGQTTPITLTCDVSAGITANVRTIGAVESHQSYAWTAGEEGLPSPVVEFLVSLLDFSNVGLTGASRDNFVFFDADLEIQNSAEFKLYVQPLPINNLPSYGAIAVDISTSLSQTQIDTMKAELTNFFSVAGGNQFYRLSSFDDAAIELVPYSNDPVTLQTGVSAIPAEAADRASSTNLYDGVQDAANSLDDIVDYVVIVTDGEHTYDAETVSSISADLEFELVFVVAVGASANIAALEELVNEPSNSEVNERVIQIASMSDLETALRAIAQNVSNMMGGMHAVYYATPRRTDTHEFRFEASPINDCSVGSSILICGWFTQYDAAGMTDEPTRIYAFSNAVLPEPNDTVRITIPDWPPCFVTPDYQWAITENVGTATGAVVTGTNNMQYDLTLGPEASVDVDVVITDANDGSCTGTVNVATP